MKMTVEELKKKTTGEVMEFIRERLKFEEGIISSIKLESLNWGLGWERSDEHKRFQMSGYEGKRGKCTLWNLSILNEFADLGIYDYTDYLFVDFYKGIPTIYLKYFQTNENIEIELSGEGTIAIIYKVFKLTIFSQKRQRRRG